MHMQGEPATMQNAPAYGDVVAEVRDWLLERVAACRAAGIAADAIAVDPGFGFGKNAEHNLALFRSLRGVHDARRAAAWSGCRASLWSGT